MYSFNYFCFITFSEYLLELKYRSSIAGILIMDILRNVSSAFWSTDVWLPPNITWEDIKPNSDNKYADYQHLIYPLPMAFALLIIRYALER